MTIALVAVYAGNLLLLAADSTTSTPDVPGWAWWVGQGGLAILAGVLWKAWRDERAERIRSDAQRFELLEREGPLLKEAVDTLKVVQESQRAVVVRSATDWDEVGGALRKLTEALDAEADTRRRPDRR